TGTAQDVGNPDQPSIPSIAIRVKRDDAQYWDTSGGGSWSGTVKEISANLVSTPGQAIVNWSSAPVVPYQNGRRYTFILKPVDFVGNVAGLESSLTQFNVIYDTTPAVAIATQVVDGQVLKSLSVLAGTASDPLGAWAPGFRSDVASVQIQIYSYSEDLYWGG